MFVYGVGDHGGGPTRRDIEYARDMATWPIFPIIRFGTARRFFEIAEKVGRNLPVLDRELNTEFPGLLHEPDLDQTEQPLWRKSSGRCRNCGGAGLAKLGFAYPAIAFDEAWRDILFNRVPRHSAG